jgi:bis(5'-nucleosyl)-tetraphosphatase (symmetrical)
MAVYAIGDVQGCYPELQRLLERLHFDPSTDRLWFCGDLVNRGGESLEVLRLIHGLREHCVITLGNHDLSLLAVAEREPEARARTNPDLRRVLEADDSGVLMEWLRSQCLAHHHAELGFTLVHAGFAPSWTLKQALHIAHEVERALRGAGHRALLQRMFGNRPARWSAAWPRPPARGDQHLHTHALLRRARPHRLRRERRAGLAARRAVSLVRSARRPHA